MPRQGDLDGRGNLSLKAVVEFTLRFLKVWLDQVTFMAGLFDLSTVIVRLKIYADSPPHPSRQPPPCVPIANYK